MRALQLALSVLKSGQKTIVNIEYVEVERRKDGGESTVPATTFRKTFLHLSCSSCFEIFMAVASLISPPASSAYIVRTRMQETVNYFAIYVPV